MLTMPLVAWSMLSTAGYPIALFGPVRPVYVTQSLPSWQSCLCPSYSIAQPVREARRAEARVAAQGQRSVVQLQEAVVARVLNGWMADRSQEIAEGARLAHRAVELGKDDAVALARSGGALCHLVGDLDSSLAFIDRALVLDPNLAAA